MAEPNSPEVKLSSAVKALKENDPEMSGKLENGVKYLHEGLANALFKLPSQERDKFLDALSDFANNVYGQSTSVNGHPGRILAALEKSIELTNFH